MTTEAIECEKREGFRKQNPTGVLQEEEAVRLELKVFGWNWN
jgi:hypothetical protein